jgi:hypothetical protein
MEETVAVVKIHAICTREGDPLDVMAHITDAVESLESGGGMYGEVRVRVVSVKGMDFSAEDLVGMEEAS